MKTKVKMLRNAANSYGCPLREGDEGSVDCQLAKQLEKAGIAECLEPPKVKAVPKEPTVAKAKEEPKIEAKDEVKPKAAPKPQSKGTK